MASTEPSANATLPAAEPAPNENASSEQPKPSDDETKGVVPLNTGPRRCNPLVFFPILICLYIPFLVLMCYFQGVVNKHYHPFLPLVSDTGNFIPESTVFCISIIMIGLLFLVVVTIRYLQLKAIILDPTFEQMMRYFYGNMARDYYYGVPPPPKIVYPPQYRLKHMAGYREKYNKMNWYLFLSGVIVSGSCMATGAFRFGDTFNFHNIAAVGVFIMTPVYMVGNTYISGIWAEAVNSLALYRRRLYIATVTCIAVALFLLTLTIVVATNGRFYMNPTKRLPWGPHQKGYMLHVINAVCEWVFLLTISPFAYTFAEDFSRLRFAGLRLTFEFYPIGPGGADIGCCSSPPKPDDSETPKKIRGGDGQDSDSPADRFPGGIPLYASSSGLTSTGAHSPSGANMV